MSDDLLTMLKTAERERDEARAELIVALAQKEVHRDTLQLLGDAFSSEKEFAVFVLTMLREREPWMFEDDNQRKIKHE